MSKLFVKAVVFDFDGVLAESVNVKGYAFYDLYDDCGEDIQQKVLEHHLANGGVSRYDKIKYYEEEFLGSAPTDEIVERRAQKFSDLVEDKVVACDWVPGAREFLDLASQNLPLFVASATPQEELERIVERRGMSGYFKGVYGSPIKKKAHIERIMQDNSWNTDQVVMVGDTISDYNAAQAAGVHFIGRHIPDTPFPFPEGTVWRHDLTEFTDLLDV